MPRLNIEVERGTWLALRRMAEKNRTPSGRASVRAIVLDAIHRFLAVR